MGALRIAIPKGRLLEDTTELLEVAGLAGPELADSGSRRLTRSYNAAGILYFLVRPSDVPTYVERGAADLGICGMDVIKESRSTAHQLLDLGYGGCKFVLAAPSETDLDAMMTASHRIRVATKLPIHTRQYFSRRSIPVDILRLHGAIEAAPAAGLADMIVEIVETGRTLQENGLVIVDTLGVSTVHLIANRTAYQTKTARIQEIVSLLERAMGYGKRHRLLPESRQCAL